MGGTDTSPADFPQLNSHTAVMLQQKHPNNRPERFVNGPSRPETLPTAVWINRPPKPTREDTPRFSARGRTLHYRTVKSALVLSPSPPRIPPSQLRLVE